MSNAVNAYLTLFHHLEQGSLRFGRSTVDLVHQYDIGKDRSLMKVKIIGFHIEHSGTQYVTRHQVRCELDTAEIRINQAGNALESLVGVRTRQIQRKLRSVTTLPEAGAAGEALEE